ncbi:MAG: 5'/3'-nucleotidase SurE [Clostridia bacterium]|jgi:5'-nucleotidase
MRILVCNDDGIYSEGILTLARSLSKIGEVTVVAPDAERSATGHAITMHDPLRVQEIHLEGLKAPCYSVDGTPADCVKLAADHLMPEKPDIVFSGINRGGNLGTDVLYSGTVSAAMEGAILGFPAAAISLASFENNDYTYAAEFAVKIAKKLVDESFSYGTLININVPNLPDKDIKGVKIAPLGVRKYNDSYVKRKDPRGQTYYWLTGGVIESENEADTDVVWINKGFITVTPLHFDLTKYSLIEELKAWNL